MLVAPLEDNTFNKAKSDLKYIEACCHGIPIACQDLCTYQNAPYKFTTGDDMLDHIKKLTRHKSTYMQACKDGRKVAEKRWLELDENNDKYVEMYRYPFMDPQRKLLNTCQ